jgi:anti-sigma regulatory factor (Ser/Thr protein kinase)
MTETTDRVTTIEAALPAPESDVGVTFTRSSIGRICTLVRVACVDAGVAPRDAEDLLIAVSEIAINAISYGGGHGAIAVHRVAGGVVIEIHDDGPGLPANFALDQPPPGGVDELHGLWLARLMCREFDITSSPRGVNVRMFTPGDIPAGSAMTR